MADIVIGGRLHSAATGNTVAGANEIMDDAQGKKQSVVNQELANRISVAGQQQQAAIEAEAETRAAKDRELKALIDQGIIEGGGIVFDLEPTPDSVNPVTSNGIAGTLGYNIDNVEFVRVVVDSQNRVVFGIRHDGDVYFGAGVPEQIQTYVRDMMATIDLTDITTTLEQITDYLAGKLGTQLTLSEELNGKVDKEEGKSLIDAEVAESFSTKDCTKWFYVIVDNENKILFGIKDDGSIDWSKGIPTPIKEHMDSIAKYSDNIQYVRCVIDANGKVLSGIMIDGTCYFNKLDSPEIQQLNNGYKLLESRWAGKNIWWCGTSIPAAGYWNVDNKKAYPSIVGERLNAARVFNEAVGSSSAKYSPNGGSYEVVSRRMGNTIADALAICNDLWTIDDTNRTVSAGPRTRGITDLPSVTTYAEVCNQRYLLLSNCYEIKLVSKYLISNAEDNETYLRQKFGNLYQTLVNLHPNAYNYQGDIDLFVIDHGHNDSPSPVADENVGTTDITTFAGAINTYIRLIIQYKPHARIAIVSDYDNWTSNVKTVEAQKQIADYWHIPFIDLRDYLPFDVDKKVKVRGYWGTDSLWHERGFTYNPQASTIAAAFAENGKAYFNSFLGNTVEQVAANITPEQDANGVWWYYTYPRYIWLKDGLHPHSDIGGRSITLYADVLSKFINNI